jgi:hypothetical protein
MRMDLRSSSDASRQPAQTKSDSAPNPAQLMQIETLLHGVIFLAPLAGWLKNRQ